MSRLFLLAIPLASCAYTPNSFSSYQTSFPGARTTVGCLDVAVTVVERTDTGTILSYSVGNRCDRVAVIDFSALRVRFASEVSFGRDLRPYDPNGELRPLRMEARAVITEQIEYRPPASVARGLCVDVGRMNGASAVESWVCDNGGES